MKFPLPANTFPPLKLSQQDAATLESVGKFFVDETMQHYHEHRHVNHGSVDPTRWKKMKQREDVCVYRDRTHLETSSRDTTTSNADLERKTQATQSMPILLTVGTIQGTLDDVMYGFSSPTPEAMKIKSAYVNDGFVDWKILASLVTPSPADPFRELSIWWNIKGHPFLVGAVMRVRDNLYLESIGFTQTEQGERIGYTIQHSVDLPDVRELHELNIVRGKVSFCHLFRQKKENVVELYVRGFVSAMGDAPASLVAISAAEFCVSIWKNMHCAQMKKLAWMVRTSTASINGPQLLPAACGVCLKSLKASSFSSVMPKKDKTCQVCLQRVCSRCRVTHPICFTTAYSDHAIQQKMTFCTACVHRARHASSRDVMIAEMLEAERGSVPSALCRMASTSSISAPSEASSAT